MQAATCLHSLTLGSALFAYTGVVSALLVTRPLAAEARIKTIDEIEEPTARDKQQANAQSRERVPIDERDILFPDWHTDAFDWNIGPVLGFRSRSTETGGVKYDTLSSEAGLGARINGIPIVPGNPGGTIEPYVSYSWGNRSLKAKNAAIDETQSTGFQRHWYGVLGRIYYQAFRYSLDVGMGKIEGDDKGFVDLTARRFQNDFGLLILPFLSTHYTVTSLAVKEGQDSEPTIDELDHWIHARVFFSTLSSTFDIGPGQTTTDYAGHLTPESPLQHIETVQATYLKALTSMTLFWKLGLSGSVKYILSADEVEGLTDSIDQLPNESLAENKSLSNLPQGSLEASVFFGLRHILGNLGVGWQVYYLERNNDKTAKQISRDQGLVVTYDAGI